MFNRIFHGIQYLAQFPSIGKALSTLCGILEVPFLDLLLFIDQFIRPGTYKQMMPYFTQFYGSRVIPVNTTLKIIPSISPTEEIISIIRRVPALSIGYCYCRKKHQNCDNPIWTCIHIGTAKRLDELGKKIPLKSSTIREVEVLLHEADCLGLVHQLITAPSPDYVYVICNCCPCCCVMLKNALVYQLHGVALSSNFIATQNTENCTLCGRCVERCYFSARTIETGKLIFDPKNCVGCGLCVSTCSVNAIHLVRRTG
ncbi:MAG: ATP-binding protein [Candidatus Hodarchaeota archaeon]